MATAVGEQGGGVEKYQNNVNNESNPSSQIASPGTDCMSSSLDNPFYQGNMMTHHIYQPRPMLATQIAPMYFPPPPTDYHGQSQMPYHAAGFAPPPFPYNTVYRNTANMYPPKLGDNVTTAATATPDSTKRQSYNHWGAQSHNQTQMPPAPTSNMVQTNGFQGNASGQVTSPPPPYPIHNNGSNEKIQEQNTAQPPKEAPIPQKQNQTKLSVNGAVEQTSKTVSANKTGNASTGNPSASKDAEKPSEETSQADTTVTIEAEKRQKSERDQKPSDKMVQGISLEEDVAATVKRFLSSATPPATRPKSAEDVEVSPDSYVFLDLDKKYYCKKCAYGSPRLDKIEQHIRAHISGKFGCDICGRAFIKKCDQQRHAIAHAHARIRPKGLEEAVKPLYKDALQTNSRPSSASSNTSIPPSPHPSPNNHQVHTNHTSMAGTASTPHQMTGNLGAKGNMATAKVPFAPTVSAINTPHHPVTRVNSQQPTPTNPQPQQYLQSVWPVKSEVVPQSGQNNYSYLRMLLGDGDLESQMFGLTGPHGLSASQGRLPVHCHGGHPPDMIDTCHSSNKESSAEIRRILNNGPDKMPGIGHTVDAGVPKVKSAKQPQARFHPYETASYDASNYGGNSMWNNNTPNYRATYIPDTAPQQYGGNMPGYPAPSSAYGDFQGVQVYSQFPDQQSINKPMYESAEPLVIAPRPMEFDATVQQPSVDYGWQESKPDMWATHIEPEPYNGSMPVIIPGKEIVIAPDDSQDVGAASHQEGMAETGITAQVIKDRIKKINDRSSQNVNGQTGQGGPVMIDVSTAHHIAGRIPPPSSLQPELSIDIPNPSALVNTSTSSNSRNLCCSICNYSTKDPWQLEKHLLAHTKGSRTCKYCNKAFERSSDLARHEELHLKNSNVCGGQVSPQTASSARKPPSSTEKPSPKQAGPKPIEVYPCDMCRGKFVSKENLTLHKESDHNTFCARFEKFEGNILLRSSFLKCEVSGQNEITLFSGLTDMTDLSIQTIPTISLPAHIPEILDRPKNQQTEREKEAMMKKGEDIWIRDQNKILAYQLLEQKRKAQSQAIYSGSQHPKRARSGEAIYRCTTCNYVSSVHSNWEQHQRAHQGRFVCEICGKAFVKSSDLSRHWMRHKTMQGAFAFSCASCPYETSDKRAIEEHMKQHGTPKHGMVPNTTTSYPNHPVPTTYTPPKVQHPVPKERPGQCRVCGMSFARPAQLKRHEQTHILNNYNPHGSPDIVNLNSFKSGNNLTPSSTAGTVMDENTFYECKYCGQDFQTESALDIHEREHSSGVPEPACQTPSTSANENSYECKYCGQDFQTENALDIHEREHNSGVPKPVPQPPSASVNENSYECKYCGQDFQTESALDIHEREHNSGVPKPVPQPPSASVNENSYECKYCGQDFQTESALDIHEREHSSGVPKPVPQSPSSANENSAPPAEGGLKCQYCDKVFKHPKYLDNHMMFHFGLADAPAKSPAECHICGKVFTSANHLKDHLRLHTGETPYSCDKCGRRFSSTRNLNRHSVICKCPE